jgi:hypothetical protein
MFIDFKNTNLQVSKRTLPKTKGKRRAGDSEHSIQSLNNKFIEFASPSEGKPGTKSVCQNYEKYKKSVVAKLPRMLIVYT